MKFTMKICAVFLGALAAYGTDCTISDTVRTPFGGYFAGKITVGLNSPSLAQPLYSGSQTLTGWQTTIDVPASANGAVAVTLVCTDSITPSGTSYAARYQPTSGAGWAETWTPATGTTTIRAMRSTTVPSPTVTFQPSQLALAAGSLIYGSSAGVGTALAAGTNGHVLTLSGGYPAWAAAGGVTSITGTANQITASASTGAVTLSLPATITGLTSVTSTGFTGALTGNASTATALAANPAACTAGQYVSDIAANGDLTCAQVAYSQLSGTSGVVTGAASLTITGAIPYVTSAGVLGQDATALFWDATNDRLGVGTAVPIAPLEIKGSSGQPLTTILATTNSYTFGSSGSAIRIGHIASSGDTTAMIEGLISGASVTGGHIAINGTNAGVNGGNIFVGGQTNGNYKLDVQKSGITGTLRVYDQTATTGSTLAVIQAGQGQSGNLLSIRNNAGAELASISSGGNIVSSALIASQEYFDTTSIAAIGGSSGSAWGGVMLGSAGKVRFRDTASVFGGTADTGLARNAAGILEINNGTAGTYRDLRVRSIFITQSTPAASSDTCTAGALWADATYIYACTASGTIKRATLATF